MPAAITLDLLFDQAKSKGQQRPKNDEPKEKFVGRMTHLHLERTKLKSSKLPEKPPMPNLKVLYIFDNLIETLEGIGSLSQLTHLYAQNNRITTLGQDLGSLKSLRKLYLNSNCLASLENLAPLTGLEELHAASQSVPSGSAFDPAPAVLASFRRLNVIDLSSNGLTSTECLAGCTALQTAKLAKNQLSSLQSVAPLLHASPLLELDLSGNSVSDTRHLLDAIVVDCPSLTTLNERELTASERIYLQRLHQLGKRRAD